MSILNRVKLGFCALGWAGPASAVEEVTCAFEAPCSGAVCLSETVALRFEIDPTQFVAPYALGEPPRNKVTLVSLGDAVFQAEPIRMADGTRGFWANVAGVEHLMTTGRDGSSRYASTGEVPFMSGRCEIEVRR